MGILLLLLFRKEWFSFECCETKTKVVTASQSQQTQTTQQTIQNSNLMRVNKTKHMISSGDRSHN